MFRHDQIIKVFSNILWASFNVVIPLPLETPDGRRHVNVVQYRRMNMNRGVSVLYWNSYNENLCVCCGHPFQGKSELHAATECHLEIINVPTAAKRLMSSQNRICGTDPDETRLYTYLTAISGISDQEELDSILEHHELYRDAITWIPEHRISCKSNMERIVKEKNERTSGR